jgi:hypothetical protein
MKVIEAQSAVLTNFEVYQHAVEQRERYKQKKRRGPPNFETVVTEVRLAQAFLSSMRRLDQYPPLQNSICVGTSIRMVAHC